MATDPMTSEQAREVADAAVEAGLRERLLAVDPEQDGMPDDEVNHHRADVEAIITAALPHLSPRPDAEEGEIERLRNRIDFWVDERDIEIERGDLARAALAAATVLAEEWRASKASGAAYYGERLSAALATPAPAPVDDREALAAVIALLDEYCTAGCCQFADHNEKRLHDRLRDVLIEAGYVKGGQAT